MAKKYNICLDVGGTKVLGAVFNEKGDVIEIRKYSFKGACSDGVDEHHLMAINGMAELGGKKKE